MRFLLYFSVTSKKVTRAQNGILGQSILGAYLAIAHGSNLQHLSDFEQSSNRDNDLRPIWCGKAQQTAEVFQSRRLGLSHASKPTFSSLAHVLNC
jgi:hypothetical protein